MSRILAIDTASHHIGVCIYDSETDDFETKMINFEYDDSILDETAFISHIKKEFKFLENQRFDQIVMEKQFYASMTREKSLDLLHQAHKLIRSYLTTTFEMRVIELEAIVWKTMVVKNLKLSTFVNYQDKNAWVNLMQKTTGVRVENNDEADAYFIAKVIAWVLDTQTRIFKKQFWIYNKNWTVVFAYDEKYDRIFEITKTNNNNVQLREIND